MADIKIVSAAELTLVDLADLMTRGFAGYFVAVNASAQALAQRIRREGIDLALSRVALRDERPVGLAFLALRGWTSRLAAMAVVEEARRLGLGQALLDAVLEVSSEEGYRRMLLEVITTNTPAVKLYKNAGFEVRHRLVGFEMVDESERPETDPAPPDALVEIDPAAAARAIRQHADVDLPWQLSPESSLGWGPPARAFQLTGEEAWVQVGPADDTIVLLALGTARGARRQGRACRLLEALRLAFPGRRWMVPGILPEGHADAFLQRCGFAASALGQFEMELQLPTRVSREC